MKVLCIKSQLSYSPDSIIINKWYTVNGYTNTEYVIKTHYHYHSINKNCFLTKKQFRKLKLENIEKYEKNTYM